jgi:hypothetical protein
LYAESAEREAWYAESAARGAARSAAWSAPRDAAAESAAYSVMADKLLALLKEAAK